MLITNLLITFRHFYYEKKIFSSSMIWVIFFSNLDVAKTTLARLLHEKCPQKALRAWSPPSLDYFKSM